jgi:hypothetical protein
LFPYGRKVLSFVWQTGHWCFIPRWSGNISLLNNPLNLISQGRGTLRTRKRINFLITV